MDNSAQIQTVIVQNVIKMGTAGAPTVGVLTENISRNVITMRVMKKNTKQHQFNIVIVAIVIRGEDLPTTKVYFVPTNACENGAVAHIFAQRWLFCVQAIWHMDEYQIL